MVVWKDSFETPFKIFLWSFWRDKGAFSESRLVSSLFNVNFKSRLSCGDETTYVCMCQPPSRHGHTSVIAQSPRKHTHIFSQMYSFLQCLPTKYTHTHAGTHIHPALLCGGAAWQESIFFWFSTTLSLAQKALLGLNRMFTPLEGGSLGHLPASSS